ncbi:Alpha/Beta hydrolase protein [Desarmillaria tabescens]|uniref:Alpha/Beta hydrolase protein n=1 Tax=Armillaria tabescens TaxID=1929756 RepID=A0AA39N4T0_ARMTA|nr:Alpha/Beta hydrolase protein [Desarmillaria tabescens]KAK0457429.1 Alpha/Beta hydrolase protein [Desarmillaria tabescens]
MTVDSQYGRLTRLEKLRLFVVLTSLVFYLCGQSLTLLFSFRRCKALKVVLALSAGRYLMDYLSLRQLQYLSPRNLEQYLGWAKERGVPTKVEELPEKGASLMWISTHQTDNVIFYCHGGGYVLPSSPGTFDFCLYVQRQLEAEGVHVNIALLTYNLIPDVKFPDPLREAISAIHHLLNCGIKSENIILMGESAGGNLVLQILSHMLHPLSSVDPLSSSLRFRGACLMSPWVSPSGDVCADEAQANDPKDDVSVRTLCEWGQLVVKDVPHTPEDMACVEPAGAPKGWFKDVEAVVGRVLMLSGEVECMAGAHRFFYEEHLKDYHRDVRMVVQPGGVHDGILADFIVGKEPSEGMTPVIIEWLAEAFRREM